MPLVDGSWPTVVAGNHGKYALGNAYAAGNGSTWLNKSTGNMDTPTLNATGSGNPAWGYGFKFGNDEKHNNLQPFCVIHCWKRIS